MYIYGIIIICLAFLRQKTPLHCALAMGHGDVVEILVKHGAKVSGMRVNTPLCMHSPLL